MGLGGLGVVAYGLAVFVFGFPQLPHLLQAKPEADAGLAQVGALREGRAQVGDGLLRIRAQTQRAEVGVREPAAGIAFEGRRIQRLDVREGPAVAPREHAEGDDDQRRERPDGRRPAASPGDQPHS